MDYTIFFLKFFGYFYLSFFVAFLLNKKLQETMISVIKDDVALFCLSISTLIMSIPVVVLHNIWDFNIVGLVTLIGWGGLLKGILFLAFPDFMRRKAESNKNFKIKLVVSLIIGLGFLYCAYYPYWI